jgi:hypothetical protein
LTETPRNPGRLTETGTDQSSVAYRIGPLGPGADRDHHLVDKARFNLRATAEVLERGILA